MTEQEQINELKAQVNCLREFIEYAPIELSHLTTASALLRKTPEQCLAEVKAKVIEDVAEAMRKDVNYTYEDDYYISFIYMQADKIREQAQ